MKPKYHGVGEARATGGASVQTIPPEVLRTHARRRSPWIVGRSGGRPRGERSRNPATWPRRRRPSGHRGAAVSRSLTGPGAYDRLT